MKTIIKSLLVAALFVGIGTNANAQLGAQSSTSATARILKQITLLTDTIQFGTVAAGGGQTFLNPQSTAGSSNIGFNSRVGRLRIDATPEEPIRVEFDEEVIMTETGNPLLQISYVPVVSAIRGDLVIDETNRNASVLVSPDAIVNPVTDVTASTNANGTGPFCLVTTNPGTDRVTMFLGGYLYVLNTTDPIPNTGPTGTFRGTLNFNVFYNN
jgi:hypothetical protein